MFQNTQWNLQTLPTLYFFTLFRLYRNVIELNEKKEAQM